MAKLDAAQRNALPDSAFLGPGRTYPGQDKSHLVNAEARAKQEEEKGKLAHSTAESIISKAKSRLKRRGLLVSRMRKHHGRRAHHAHA